MVRDGVYLGTPKILYVATIFMSMRAAAAGKPDSNGVMDTCPSNDYFRFRNVELRSLKPMVCGSTWIILSLLEERFLQRKRGIRCKRGGLQRVLASGRQVL